jgi:hypothetical protein
MRRFLRALLPLWALFCDLMEDPESWSAGIRLQYTTSLLSLRKSEVASAEALLGPMPGMVSRQR